MSEIFYIGPNARIYPVEGFKEESEDSYFGWVKFGTTKSGVRGKLLRDENGDVVWLKEEATSLISSHGFSGRGWFFGKDIPDTETKTESSETEPTYQELLSMILEEKEVGYSGEKYGVRVTLNAHGIVDSYFDPAEYDEYERTARVIDIINTVLAERLLATVGHYKPETVEKQQLTLIPITKVGVTVTESEHTFVPPNPGTVTPQE